PVTGADAVNFYDYKGNAAYHDPRRRLGYHYAISGHSSCNSRGEIGVDIGAGMAEGAGNDLVVSPQGDYTYARLPTGVFCTSDADCCPSGSCLNLPSCDPIVAECTALSPCLSDAHCPTGSTCVLGSGVCVSTASRLLNYRAWAGLFMHELGHNLGLCHGGGGGPTSASPCEKASVHYAPNHISSTNSPFQL